VPFAEYAETWFGTLTSRPRTIEAYRGSYERYLKPKLGSKRLAEITVDHVAALIADMSRKGFRANTIQSALTPLSLIFRHAERAGLIATSPVRKLHASERPTPDASERRSLEPSELTSLLAKAGNARALLAVGAFAGLRMSEVLGLVWEDIDFEGGFICVRKQLDRKRQRVDVKSGRSVRDVVLVPELAKLLKEHRIASRHKSPDSFVFAMPDGRGRSQLATAQLIRRVVERAGLRDVTFHCLRHTFASMLIGGLKMDVETVSRQLGHANSSITLKVYSHEFDRARTAENLRKELSQQFGHLLAAPN
jgi:integrase